VLRHRTYVPMFIGEFLLQQ